MAYWLSGPHVAARLARVARPLCVSVDALLEVVGRLGWLRVGHRQRPCHPTSMIRRYWSAWSTVWRGGYVYWLPDVTVAQAQRWAPYALALLLVLVLVLILCLILVLRRRRH